MIIEKKVTTTASPELRFLPGAADLFEAMEKPPLIYFVQEDKIAFAIIAKFFSRCKSNYLIKNGWGGKISPYK